MGAISLRHVVKRYGVGPKANQVIHGVDAEIADGEFVVIFMQRWFVKGLVDTEK